jgi:hypothetical protein
MSYTSKFEVAAVAPDLLKLVHTELYKLSKAVGSRAAEAGEQNWLRCMMP